MTIMNADIVVGLAWGDEGKGKITSYLARNNNYNYVCRWAGGPNAGHTVYIDGKKYKTHLIPSGVFHGIPSIIGPGCVLNPIKFKQELSYLEEHGFDTSLIKVAPNTHIITQKHIELDKKNLSGKLGTTSNGIAYCYADKAARSGLTAKDCLPDDMIWDQHLEGNILCEGAQGVWLDLDWGNYPYVTSSTTLPYAACSLGFSPRKIRDIWGVAKIYDTRSGEDPRFPEMNELTDPSLLKLADIGQEFGVTTGRARKVKWLNLNLLLKSIKITGTNKLIINKCDIFTQAGKFAIEWNEDIITFYNFADMKDFISDILARNGIFPADTYFSGHPEIIQEHNSLEN